MSEFKEFIKSKEVQDFNAEIAKYNLGPLWEAIPLLMRREPTPQAVPYLWKRETIYAKMMEAREIFTPQRGGERRVLYLQNPGLKNREPWGWGSTTNTLFAAVQLLLPGETAPSHRHSQNALRFITNGKGAYTIVQGQRIWMNEGDFLITPKGLWHGHSHLGDEPMMWMDSLDIPTKFAIAGTFFEDHPDYIEQPSVPDDYGAEVYAGGMVRPIAHRKYHIAPVGKYKWERTLPTIEGLAKYDPDPYDGYAVEYLNPSNGETANPTIAAWMQKLPAGFRGKAHRHTHAVVYHAFRGSGYTVINGVRFDWQQGDYFVVPNWAWHEHVAHEDSFLFSVSDLPIMEKFDVEQEQAYESNNGHQEIKEEFKPLLPTSNVY